MSIIENISLKKSNWSVQVLFEKLSGKKICSLFQSFRIHCIYRKTFVTHFTISTPVPILYLSQVITNYFEKEYCLNFSSFLLKLEQSLGRKYLFIVLSCGFYIAMSTSSTNNQTISISSTIIPSWNFFIRPLAHHCFSLGFFFFLVRLCELIIKLWTWLYITQFVKIY